MPSTCWSGALCSTWPGGNSLEMRPLLSSARSRTCPNGMLRRLHYSTRPRSWSPRAARVRPSPGPWRFGTYFVGPEKACGEGRGQGTPPLMRRMGLRSM
eukprot:11387394-Alexandrium_andersonii.AAC.1